MNRRQFAACLPVAGLLAGCDSDQRPSAAATLLNNGRVQDAMKGVESSLGDLEVNVDSFDNEDWRDVVPEIKSSVDEVREAFERLRQALGVSNA
ncbi:hypothetical protein ACPOL_3419 [Acidisarcina polymorpha]|uniref:Uncharacterized protein n=1 Tax=Acidisarcina polymorpha TaxID=2211140 RepID=A0A2Z5G2E7_9BACT|nr:hypothetical protein [Acidisarcina polymorpha]AXC12706.1 hypothetical protein ACPOL_3419 [Acidisarcina polymorpha]